MLLKYVLSHCVVLLSHNCTLINQYCHGNIGKVTVAACTLQNNIEMASVCGMNKHLRWLGRKNILVWSFCFLLTSVFTHNSKAKAYKGCIKRLLLEISRKENKGILCFTTTEAIHEAWEIMSNSEVRWIHRKDLLLVHYCQPFL